MRVNCDVFHKMGAAMFELAVIFAVQCAVLAAVVVLRDPKLLVVAVVLGLPLELLETRVFDTLSDGSLPEILRSLLNPGQVAMVAAVGVAAVRLRHQPARLIPNSALVLPVAVLFGLHFIGVAWSDSLVPGKSVLVLVLYGAFIVAAPTLIENRRDLERIVAALLAVAIFLSLVAVAQRLLDVFTWHAVLGQTGTYRSNATFTDPNNFARFLAVVIPLAVALVLVTGPRRLTVYLALPAIAVGGVAILASTSRAGLMMLALTTFIILWTVPIATYTRLKLTAVAGVALVAMVAALLAFGGAEADRIRELSRGVAALGRREYLIRAGWEMFKDNPIMGVGAGNFQGALLSPSYRDLVPPWAQDTTLSHTSIVTVMAELGILGLAAFAFVVVRLATTLRRVYRSTESRFDRLMIGWLAASFVGIFFHSQSEGRLLEEPYLWVLVAIAIAMETGPAFAARSVPGTRPDPSTLSALEEAHHRGGMARPLPAAPGHAARVEH